MRAYQFSTKVSVPNVVGLTQSEAETQLSAAGFNRVKFTTESSATVPAGTVISQSPVYSDTAKYPTATIITVVVSSGSGSEIPSEGVTDIPQGPGEEITTAPGTLEETTVAPPVITEPSSDEVVQGEEGIEEIV